MNKLFPDLKDIATNKMVFFKLETNIPPSDILEFGAITLDKNTYQEIERYQTFIYSDNITEKSLKTNGIRSFISENAPQFEDVCSEIFKIMDGNIWVGHNINTFHGRFLIKQFENRILTPPIPSTIIDTFLLMKNIFNKTDDLKLETLSKYFGLGDITHRSLSDCKLNIEIFKNCCVTVF